MKTASFLNQKGGVGKSTLTFHLGGALADLGLRVLLVDYDPQASLAQGFLGPDCAAALPADRTTAAIASGAGPDPRDLMLAVGPGGPGRELWLVPGSIDAAACNLANPFACETRMRLRRFLAEAAEVGRFDACLIDCPPNLQMAAAEALAGSDWLVVPTAAEDFGAQGLRPVLEFLSRSAEDDGSPAALAGIVLNRVRRRVTLHSTFEARLREHYRERVFRAVVPETVAYAESISYQTPVAWHDPQSNAARAMRGLASEFLARIGGDLP